MLESEFNTHFPRINVEVYVLILINALSHGIGCLFSRSGPLSQKLDPGGFLLMNDPRVKPLEPEGRFLVHPLRYFYSAFGQGNRRCASPCVIDTEACLEQS